MTTIEARILLLETLLNQSRNKIEFLHGCLTEPDHYKYAYPKQTAEHLREIEQLIGAERKGCIHSFEYPNCKECQKREEWRAKYHKALTTLGLSDKFGRK